MVIFNKKSNKNRIPPTTEVRGLPAQFVGEYLHEGTTNVIKGYLEKAKKEIIEKLNKRVSEIDELIVELSKKEQQ